MLPARHRLTHVPEYIAASDTAWDHDRINRELGLALLRASDAGSLLRSLARAATEVGDAEPVELDAQDQRTVDAAIRWCLGDVEPETDPEGRARQLLECAEKIDASPWAGRDDHPVWRYWLGETRKDLRLAQGWLLPGVPPVKFTLRLLSRAQRIEIDGIASSEREGSQDLASLRAVRYGLTMIDGPGSPKIKAWEKGKAPELTERDLDTIEDAFGSAILLEVGYAIRSVARDLFETEKKA